MSINSCEEAGCVAGWEEERLATGDGGGFSFISFWSLQIISESNGATGVGAGDEEFFSDALAMAAERLEEEVFNAEI